MKARIGLIGGTGILGRSLANLLASNDFAVQFFTPRPQRLGDLRVLPQLKIVDCNVFDAQRLAACFYHCDIVINLTTVYQPEILRELRKHHVYLSRLIINAARSSGVSRYLHLSALHADASSSNLFLRTKGEGENLIHNQSGPSLEVTSFRPAILFGNDDDLLNRLLRLVRRSPHFLPLPGAEARLRPVFAGDVAKVIYTAIDDVASIGQRVDICGPEEYSLRELTEYVAEMCNFAPNIVGLPRQIPGRFPVKNYTSANAEDLEAIRKGRKQCVAPTSLRTIAPLILSESARY